MAQNNLSDGLKFDSWEEFKLTCLERLADMELNDFVICGWIETIELTIKRHQAIADSEDKNAIYDAGKGCYLCNFAATYHADLHSCTACPWSMTLPDGYELDSVDDVMVTICTDNSLLVDNHDIGIGYSDQSIKRLTIWRDLLYDLKSPQTIQQGEREEHYLAQMTKDGIFLLNHAPEKRDSYEV